MSHMKWWFDSEMMIQFWFNCLRVGCHHQTITPSSSCPSSQQLHETEPGVMCTINIIWSSFPAYEQKEKLMPVADWSVRCLMCEGGSTVFSIFKVFSDGIQSYGKYMFSMFTVYTMFPLCCFILCGPEVIFVLVLLWDPVVQPVSVWVSSPGFRQWKLNVIKVPWWCHTLLNSI